VANEGGDGVERGRARADARAVGVGDGDGDCGVREAAEAPGARELAVVKRGLLGAGGREHDGVPGRHARRVASREPQPAPGLAQRRRRLPRCVGPPPAPVARRRLHRPPSHRSDESLAVWSVPSVAVCTVWVVATRCGGTWHDMYRTLKGRLVQVAPA
jgi:hypothetical protein